MKSLPERFMDSMKSLGVDIRSDKILLAVSGGLDSMVMMHLFYRAGYKCQVAHCNFGLRGEDSIADEKLVKRIAAQYRFPFHSVQFSTADYAHEHKLSIQMAARELRYKWFAELSEKSGITYTATAHHADDVAETILLNLIRGTGLTGMQGIRKVMAKRIRPLLFATRNELETYAEKQRLHWRTDTSNNENYYRRNRIRNLVMPVLKDINPSVSLTMAHHARIMEGYEKLLDHYISGLEPGLTTNYFDGTIRSISTDKLNETPAPASVLYHLLKPYGIPAHFCDELLNAGTGAEFHHNGYRLVRDRNEVTLFVPGTGDESEYAFSNHEGALKLKYGTLTMETSEFMPGKDFSVLPGFGEKSVAYVDAAALKFPLTVRRWQAGDRFQPLGMHGTRLVSDYFTDEKFSSAMKEVVYLLLSDSRVVWVAGHRIGEPFRLHPDSTRLTRFTFQANN